MSILSMICAGKDFKVYCNMQYAKGDKYKVEKKEDTGVINVEWFAEPYGTVQIEARYWLYQKGSENFFGELEYVKEHFQQM